MNYQEMLVKLRSVAATINVAPEDLVIGAGAAMLLMGLRETCGDIDIDVEPAIFERLSQLYPIETKPGGIEVIRVDPFVEIHKRLKSRTVVPLTITDAGVRFNVTRISTSELILQKKWLMNAPWRSEQKRKKDKEDLDVITTWWRKIAGDPAVDELLA